MSKKEKLYYNPLVIDGWLNISGGVSPTLKAEREHAIFRVYDWHRQDTRMTELKDICVTAAAGWGGWR